jgi:hypothetical protein
MKKVCVNSDTEKIMDNMAIKVYSIGYDAGFKLGYEKGAKSKPTVEMSSNITPRSNSNTATYSEASTYSLVANKKSCCYSCVKKGVFLLCGGIKTVIFMTKQKQYYYSECVDYVKQKKLKERRFGNTIGTISKLNELIKGESKP